MSETNEIVIYDKNTYEVHTRICTEGVSEMHIAQQLDAIYHKLDWSSHDVIHICPENKPNMLTYKAFAEAMRRIPNAPTVGVRLYSVMVAAADRL